MQHKIKFGSKQIAFSLDYKERKSLTIKVHPDSRVEVIAPKSAEEKVVLNKVREKAPWILKQIAQFNSYRPATPTRRFVNGETHLYMGRQYRLKVIKKTINSIKVYNGWIHMQALRIAATSLVVQLYKWYTDRARIIFNEILAKVMPRFKRYGVLAPDIIIRKMSKRWGSCTSSGKIILNTELIRASRPCIEYVIIHELCHLVHRNHSKTFYNLLNRLMPDWEKWKRKLEFSLA